MAYDTTEAVAKFLSGFQMKITNRERDTVAPDYYVKYSLTLSKGGKDFSTTFVSDPRASGEPTVTQVFSALADDALTLRKYSTDEFCDGMKPSAAIRAYNSCKEVFGILPGADDGGYSLSGEAKEAALSRFALPENRKAALDVIRKLNESRDSNENAL